MELLLAYDGSATARQALLNIGRCAMPPGSAVTVITVDDMPWEEYTPGRGPVVVTATREVRADASGTADALALETARRIGAMLPDLRIAAVGVAGAPGPAILETATRRRSGLIVVGTGELAGMLGPTTREVIRGATAAVRIVRKAPDLPSRAPAHIVVGIDGSEDSMRLIHAVASRAWPIGSRIWLVTARDVHDGLSSYRDDLRTVSCHTLWAEMLRSGYIDVASVMEPGTTSGLIEQVAATVDAELILLAAAHRPEAASIAPTSVAETIAAAASCPVEIW